MTSYDPYLQEVYPEPPLVENKRQKNIKDMIIRAKVAKENIWLKRNLKGMKKCNKYCTACPYVQEGSEVKRFQQTWNITIQN